MNNNKNRMKYRFLLAASLLLAGSLSHAAIPPGYTVIDTVTYEYDADGNRISRSATVGLAPETPIEAQYDQGNRLTQLTLKGQGQNGVDTTCTLTYDATGNLNTKTCLDIGSTTSPATTTYTWDSRNRLTQLQSPGIAANFHYDPLGRRIQRTVNGHTTHYLYDGSQAIAELDDGNTVSASYLTGLAIDEVIARYTTEGERTLLTDALGSVLISTKEDTTITSAYGYSAYGETQVYGTDEHNPIQYTARENDDTGLYYYRARYYDPQLKRFISEDPIGIDGGINVYVYVDGNPISYIDPMGLSSIEYIRSEGTIYVYDGDGNLKYSCAAGNNLTKKAKKNWENGNWTNGTYSYSHYNRHAESSTTGSYGSHGIHVFTVPGHSGVGVHSGRNGPESVTEGCVRTTDPCMELINELHKTDPLIGITIRE